MDLRCPRGLSWLGWGEGEVGRKGGKELGGERERELSVSLEWSLDLCLLQVREWYILYLRGIPRWLGYA